MGGSGESRRVGRVIRHLRWMIGIVGRVRGSDTVHESVGRCDLGLLPLHDVPDESNEYTEDG